MSEQSRDDQHVFERSEVFERQPFKTVLRPLQTPFKERALDSEVGLRPVQVFCGRLARAVTRRLSPMRPESPVC